MALNLLTEPIIQTNAGGLSLPGVLAAMARGDLTRFDGIRPHQRPSWHMFLVQLAVLALDGAGRADPPQMEPEWRDLLRGLTSDWPYDTPWRLVGDEDKPAFLQPPAVRDAKWTDVETPDGLDMVITSRNHELKVAVARNSAPQDWVFALVSLQTMEGFGGAGNYGIARMNGGSSSRPMVSLAPATKGGATVHQSLWWQRDVRRLMSDGPAQQGLGLVWLRDWPTGSQLRLDQLHSSFIEVCRHVRLFMRDGAIIAKRSTSKSPRIAAKEAKGVTGDPWAPIHIKENKGFTLGEDGNWTYTKLRQLLLSGEWALPPLATTSSEERHEDMILVADAFARGNSKTGGFKSRLIPMPKTIVRRAFGTEAMDLSAELMNDIRLIDRALRDALALLAANGDPDKNPKDHYARTGEARAVLDGYADANFYSTLWEMLACPSAEDRLQRRAAFMSEMAREARKIFDAAVPTIHSAAIARHRAEARAKARLVRGLAFALRDSGLVDHIPTPLAEDPRHDVPTA